MPAYEYTIEGDKTFSFQFNGLEKMVTALGDELRTTKDKSMFGLPKIKSGSIGGQGAPTLWPLCEMSTETSLLHHG